MKRKFLCVLICICLALNTLVIGTWAEGTLGWDIRLSAENVTPTGMTLVIDKIGSNANSYLEFGEDYWLEIYTAGTWEKLNVTGNANFNCPLYNAPLDDRMTEEISWSFMYDPLSPGRYRFAKEYTLSDRAGSRVTSMYYANFVIAGEHTCISQDEDAICDICDAILEHECQYERNGYRCDLCGQIDPAVYLKGANWGVSLHVKDLTPAGMTLVGTQAGGSLLGELEHGDEFYIEMYENGGWKPVPYLNSVAFTAIAHQLEKNSNWRLSMDWEDMYGQLSPGHYRLVKEFMDFRENGYDAVLIFAEFIIAESHDCHSEDGDVICDVCLSLVDHQSKDEDGDGRCDLCGIWDEYRVVGSAPWMGNWDPASDLGLMHRQEDGSYQVTFEDVPPGSYTLQVTKNGSWNESWGDAPGENYSITHCAQQDLTVSFTMKDGAGLVTTNAAPAVTDDDEEDRETSADTGDRSLLPIAVLLAAGTTTAGLLLRRKKYS